MTTLTQDPEFTDDIGTRVRAVHVDDNPPREMRGEIIAYERVVLDDGTDIGDTPVIRLDDGREWRGWECFWMKEGEE